MGLKDYQKKCFEDMAFSFRKEFNIRAFDVETQSYGLVPLDIRQRTTQVAIIEETERQLRERGFVRIIIDKSRKEGCSTLIQAISAWVAMTTPHTHSVTVAHEGQATKELFNIGKLIAENVDYGVFPEPSTKPKNNKITWKNGSRAECYTQGGSADSARGSTPTFLHISELPSWETARRSSSAADVAQALLTAVPKSPGTFIYIESTAKGMGNLFHEMWVRAIKDESGNLYVPMFFSWKDNAGYTIPAPSKALEKEQRYLSEQFFAANDSGDEVGYHEFANALGYSDIQRKRAIEYKLTPEQIRFWQTTLISDCNADQDRFDEEWPLSWEISFIATGRSVFSKAQIQRRLKELSTFEVWRSGSISKDDGKVVVTRDGGKWQFYKAPKGGHQYIVSADAAVGGRSKTDDYSAIQVFDRKTQEQVAEYYAKVPPDCLATEIALAAEMYHDALVVPEVNGPGLAVIHFIIHHHPERKLYRRYSEAGKVAGGHTRQLGYSTNERTRPYMFSLLESLVRNNQIELYSSRLLGEMLTLIRSNATGRPEAAPGYHDDACIALAIAVDVDRQQSDRGIQAYEEPETAHPIWLEGGNIFSGLRDDTPIMEIIGETEEEEWLWW